MALAFTQLRRVRHSQRWIFRGYQFAYATTCRVASLLLRRLLPGFQRLGHLTAAGYNYDGIWAIPSMGLSPTGATVSVAAPELNPHGRRVEHWRAQL